MTEIKSETEASARTWVEELDSENERLGAGLWSLAAPPGVPSELLAGSQACVAAAAEMIFDLLPQGIIIADAAGCITYVNRAAQELHGAGLIGLSTNAYAAAYEPSTETGERLSDAQLPLARAALNGKPVEGARWLIRRPDGAQVVVTGSAAPIKDGTGQTCGAILTAHDDTQRAAVEAALRASEEYNKRVLASSPDCIKILSLDGRLESMTAGGMCVMEVDDFGLIKNADWPSFWDGEEHAKALSAVDEARRGHTARFQGFAKTLKGTPRWWDVTVSPMNGPGGQPEKLLSISRDITPIMEAQATIREREERLRITSRRLDAILANTQMAVFLMDDRQHCIYANPAAEALTGYAFAEMQGRPLHDVIHHTRPDGRAYPLEECPIDRAFPARANTQGEEVFVAPDGSFYPVAFTASPVLDDTGAPIGTVIEARNIREEKARDAALRELNESLERRITEAIADRDRTWNNSRDLLGVVDSRGIIKAANPAWANTLGWAPAEVIDRDFRCFIHPEDLASSEQALSTASRTELRSYENRYRHKDGHYRWISWVAAPEGGLIYASGRDVTDEKIRGEELQKAQDALRHGQKIEAVGQLTGGVAHDFNNLLMVIMGNIDLARRAIRQENLAKAERGLDNATLGAERAATLTQRLLAFSRQQPLQPRSVDANELLRGMSELLRRTLEESVEIEFVPGERLWPVQADPNQLESAILNLAINARDAMAGRGKLTIETANVRLDSEYAELHEDVEAGDYVFIGVSDTGSGMSSETMTRAFEPFYTTKDVGKGTGLGLSMVHGFVKQSGGHVQIYSEQGHGTTIKVYFPRSSGAANHRDDCQDEVVVPQGSELVLVVEDDDGVRAYTTEILRELGYRVLEAHDGPSALRLLAELEEPIDLLFTDVVMPGMTGRELASEVRITQPGTRILFTTGYARNAIVQGGRLEPGVILLPKPFTRAALAAKLREALG